MVIPEQTASEKRSDILESSVSLLFLLFFSVEGRPSRTLRLGPSIGKVVGSCCGSGVQYEDDELRVRVRECLTENWTCLNIRFS